MNILWLSHLVPYPPKGGVLQRAYNLVREVARYHTVDLIAFNQPALLEPLFSSLDEGIDEARDVLGGVCRHIEFLPIPSDQVRYGMHLLALKSLFTKDPYTVNWLKSSEYGQQVQAFLGKYNYDLVHFDTISLVPYIKHIQNIPMVLDHHNIESHMLFRRASKESNFLKKWYFEQEGRRLERVEKLVCPEFALNITCSEIDRDRLLELSPESRAEEIPNGVDIDYFKHDESIEQEVSLVFAGTLNWYPNIEAVRFIAYKLWPQIKQAIPGMIVDILGANPPDDLKQLSENEPGFRVHGFVDDVRPFIDRAAIYVCPINDGGGTKLKILDALAMQKAIVAHPIACEGIKVEEGKDVLFASTTEEYIEHIKNLMGDEALRQRLGVNARRLIEEKYAYSIIGQKLSRMYEECVKTYIDQTETTS